MQHLRDPVRQRVKFGVGKQIGVARACKWHIDNLNNASRISMHNDDLIGQKYCFVYPVRDEQGC
jgi:hypothetical protein